MTVRNQLAFLSIFEAERNVEKYTGRIMYRKCLKSKILKVIISSGTDNGRITEERSVV